MLILLFFFLLIFSSLTPLFVGPIFSPESDLKREDIKKLERTISGYFDYIERLVENHTELTMANLSESVNKFLEFNEFRILAGKGNISHQQAKLKVANE